MVKLLVDLSQNVGDGSVKASGVGSVFGREVVVVSVNALREEVGKTKLTEVNCHIVNTVLEDDIQHLGRVRVADVTAGQHGVVVRRLNELGREHDEGFENLCELLLFNLIRNGGGMLRVEPMSWVQVL